MTLITRPGFVCVLLAAAMAMIPAAAFAQMVTANSLPWDAMDSTPETVKQVVRWKTLVGRDVSAKPELLFGELEIAPFGVYPGHKHPSPEVYYVISGRIRWTLGDETFMAEAGSTIFTPPGTVHRMENLGEDIARAVWMWWAPGGDTAVFGGKYEITEPLPEQAENARFPEASIDE